MSDSVVRLGEKQVSGVVDVLCDAFAGYPVMEFVLGAGGERAAERLRRLIHFFVMARVHRREFLFGIADGGTLQAAALVSRPAVSANPPALETLREEVWRELGAGARARYEAYGSAVAPFVDPAPHLHLNVIGVRHAAHGRGHARKLLDHVHALSRDDPASSGVSLTTEVERNVALYEHVGYRVLGRVDVGSALTSWGFFRPDAE